MEKLTDAEIKKALELCATLDENNCKKCPCREVCNEVDGELTKMVLDLINRQKAENKELIEDNADLNETIVNLLEQIKDIKTEAYKEFAEMVVSDYPETDYYLEKLLKELTEGCK